VAIGLGGNLGDPLSWFRHTAGVFARHLRSLSAAALYRSEPLSSVPQPPYLNSVLAGLTSTPPEDLLAIAKALERSAGRVLGPRDAPRPLDIDLLLYGDVVRGDAELRLPHPALRARRFALAPLADLEPERRLPPDGRTVREVLAELDPIPGVIRLGPWWRKPSAAPAPIRSPER